MADFILSNWHYLIIAVLGIAVAVLGWPWALVLAKHFKRGPGGFRSMPKERETKAEGSSHADRGEMEKLTRDVLAQLKMVNENLASIHRLVENNHLILFKHQQQSAQGTNTNLLKLSMSYESFANTLQSLMQRNIDALHAIAAQAESRLETQHQAPPLPRPPAADDGARAIARVTTAGGVAATAHFDELIDKIKDDINQASYKGLRNVQLLLEQVGQKHPIRIDSPSDQVFILVDGGAQVAPTGRAFVLPGSYLGRPWVEWFEMPKGVFERVEGTVDPAIVTRDANGDWNLVKLGTLSQQ